MAVLNRESFLKRVVVEAVELPNGDTVYIRALPASFFIGKPEDEPVNDGDILTRSLCDEKGQPMFTDGEAETAMTVDLPSLKAIMSNIVRLNGLKSRNEGEIEQAEKN